MTDPGCPWAWSASPVLAELRWRFGDGLRWRHVMIGLTERAEQYEQRGYTPLQSALGHRKFHVYGMPFASHVKRRVSATAPACRVVVAARLRDPAIEWRTLRALQIAHFTTPARLEDRDDLPKTRSGKIMRRLLRDIAEGRELGDVTTLRDPAVMEQLEGRIKELQDDSD